MVLEISSAAQLSGLTTAAGTIVVIDFYATWCGPCQAVAPHFARLADTFRTDDPNVRVVFCKVDVDRHRDIAQRYEVRAMPTFAIIHEGRVEERVQGADIGRVESFVRMLVGYVQQQQRVQRPASASSQAAAPRPLIPDGPAVDVPTRLLLQIASVPSQSEQESTVAKELLAYLQAQTMPSTALKNRPSPLGLALVPYVACAAYAPDGLQRFLSYLIREGPASAADGDAAVSCKDGVCSLVPPPADPAAHSGGLALDAATIVTNIIRFVTAALGKASWVVTSAGGETNLSAAAFDPMAAQIASMMGRGPNAAAPSAQKGPSVSYDGRWHRVAHRLLRLEAVQQILFTPGAVVGPVCGDAFKFLTPSPYILPRGVAQTGKALEQFSLLGALLAPGLFPTHIMSNQQPLAMLALYAGTAGTGDVAVAAEALRPQLQQCLVHSVERTFAIFRDLLGRKGPARTNVLLWIKRFLELNAGFSKTMRNNSELTSDTAALVMTFVLVDLALPIVNASAFEPSIAPDYTWDLDRRLEPLPAVVATATGRGEAGDEAVAAARCAQEFVQSRVVAHFGLNRRDVERIAHYVVPSEEVLSGSTAQPTIGDDEELLPLPRVPPAPAGSQASVEAALAAYGVNQYPPKVHLFFGALRALSLTQTSMFIELDSLGKQLQHPSVDPRQKTYIRSRIAFLEAMLTTEPHARRSLQFMNGAARWLLHILNPNRSTGELPADPPRAWLALPQQIVDDVFRTTKLVTRLEVRGIHATDLHDILSLLLALMGNLTFFPKAHTHALFPELILQLLQSPAFKDALVRHPWFQGRIILGLVHTYIAMEQCPYDRIIARYHLSCCLRALLKEDVLCFAARGVLEDSSNRVLERFTHMVTSEANAAIDDAMEALTKMSAMEVDGKPPTSPPPPPAGAPGAQPAGGRRGQNRRRRNDAGEDEDDEEDNPDAPPTYEQYGDNVRNSLLLYGVTIDVFRALSTQFPKGVLQHMVAQQIANMLVRALAKLAGPNSRELRVADAARWGFRPREMLGSVVECIVQFKAEKTFIGHMEEGARSVTTPADFHYAIDNICSPARPLVIPSLCAEMREVQKAVRQCEAATATEDAIWDDEAPEWCFCALMSTPLREPLALPTAGNDLTFVEGDVIRHALLKEEVNPFNRQALSVADLEAFNQKPHVIAALAELRANIDAYRQKRRAELQDS